LGAKRRNIGMALPFLDLGDVGFVRKGDGGAQGVGTAA
jgi:hypothetical protein